MISSIKPRVVIVTVDVLCVIKRIRIKKWKEKSFPQGGGSGRRK